VTAEPLRPIDVTQVDLRADPSELPFDAPEANTATTWDGRDVLWLGPDEWLVVGAAGTEVDIAAELERALDGRLRSIVDVSAARIAFHLEDALDRLATGCSIDLDPSRWLPGRCAQTLFGHAQILLHQLDGRTTRVFVRPSFAGYLIERLEASA
jgi:sarcosine oxidase subunit gamma